MRDQIPSRHHCISCAEPESRYQGGAMWQRGDYGPVCYITMIGSQHRADGPDMALISDPREHGSMTCSTGDGKALFFPDELRAELDARWRFLGFLYDLWLEPWELLEKQRARASA